MKDIAVVFDTNACRDICDRSKVQDPANEWKQYDERLKSRGMLTFANPYVFMELMAHLADESDPDYDECRSAICALYHLSAVNSQQVRIVADSEALVLHALYGLTLPETEQTTQCICTLAIAIENTHGALDSSLTAKLQQIQDHLSKMQEQFISDIWQFVVQAFNPSSIGWAPLENDETMRNVLLNILRSETMPQAIATAFVVKAMHQARHFESPAKLLVNAQFVSTTFPASIELYRETEKDN